MTTKTLKYATLLATTLPVAAVANTGTEQTVDLPKTVVTGKQVEAPSSHDIELDPSLNSKLQVPLEDLARSVDIISSEKFTEKGAINLQETLNYSAGVFPSAFGLDTRIDSIHVRGLDPEKFQDGFKGFEGFYNAPRAETFTLENVEVIKGPASTLYGQGALGGIINANSKLPKAEARTELSMQVGSDNRFQTGIDSTGKIKEDGTLLYRLVALGRSSETEVDFVDDDAMVLMPSITWQPSEDTTLTLLANWQDHKTGSTVQFIPNLSDNPGTGAGPIGADTLPPLSTLDIDPKTFVGEPDFDKYETESESYSLMFEHKINDNLSIATNSRYWDSESRYQYVQPISYLIPPGLSLLQPGLGLPTLDTPGDVFRAGYRSDGELNIISNNIVLKMDGNLLGAEHSAQFGVDYIDADTKDDRPRDPRLPLITGSALSGYFLLPSKINLLNPVYSGAPTVPTTTEYRDFSNQQTGVYFGDVIRAGGFISSINFRYDYVRQSYDRQGIDTVNRTDFTNWTETQENLSSDASVMYQFRNGVSPYLSYAESFTPNEATPEGRFVDPREGSQYELGAKFLSDDEHTFVTAAVFKIDEDNRVQSSDPSDFRVFDATYEGLELSVDHRMADFFVQASYTYLDAKQDFTNNQDPTKNLSNRDVPQVADQLINTWVSYIPGGEGSNGFRAGAGARHIGNTTSDKGNFETASYTLFDAMLGYRINEFDLQLNVTNLTDKEHITAISEANLGNSAFPGQGRFANLTAKIVF